MHYLCFSYLIHFCSFFRFVCFFGPKDLSDNRGIFAMKVVMGLSDLCPQLKLCIDTEQVLSYSSR